MLSRLRALWRTGRNWPVVRTVLAGADRAWWARTIRKADIVDLDYVSAQLARPVSPRAAVRTYVRGGFREGLRLNPLFVDGAVGDNLPDFYRVPPLYAYLVNDPAELQISPLWDAPAYLRRHPNRAGERGGALGAVWHRRETDPIPFGTHDRPVPTHWAAIRRTIVGAVDSARRRSIDHQGSASHAFDEELLIALGDGESDFDEALSEAIQFADSPLRASAIAVTDTRAEVWTQVALLASIQPRVRAVFLPGQDPLTGIARLVSTSRAAVVVARGPHQRLDVEAARELAKVAASGFVVAPLWLDSDGTIAAAGATSNGRLLAGHPVEDTKGLGPTTLRLPALAGTTFAAQRRLIPAELGTGDIAAVVSNAARLAGVDAVVRSDLVTRSLRRAPHARLPPIADSAAAILERAGWTTTADGPAPRLRRAPRSATLADGRRVPVLRWALKTAAPTGPRGEWWGDTHFARALADALRRLGQEVVIDAYEARTRATHHLDDVTVALRGPEPIDPPGSNFSVMWVISHPDEITPTAARSFDLMFAASAPWATEASERFGREVRPLLQCTDATRFRPAGLARTTEIVFVGTARGIYRPSVVTPVRAGIPVHVYGPDWRGWIPASAIKGTGVPNAELPAVYESAGVILNDHWPAMQQEGFIANRPYDVVAAGGRVVSDHVEGIEELFGGAVATYRDEDELVAMLSGDLALLFPHDHELASIAAGVRENHSFDARALTLLDAVLAAR